MEVVLFTRVPARRPTRPVERRDVGFHAEDRLEVGCLRLAEELHGAVEVAVVGHRQGGHPKLFGPLDQGGDLACPVQEAVMAVAMKMHKRPARHSSPRRSSGHEVRTRRLEAPQTPRPGRHPDRSNVRRICVPSVPIVKRIGRDSPPTRRRIASFSIAGQARSLQTVPSVPKNLLPFLRRRPPPGAKTGSCEPRSDSPRFARRNRKPSVKPPSPTFGLGPVVLAEVCVT